jgi:hypothetical protein
MYLKDRPFCQILTAGVLAGSLNVPNSVTDSAPGHAYDLVVYDTSSGIQTDLGAIYGIGGATWSLDSYQPSYTVPTTSAFTFTTGSGAAPTSCVEPAIYAQKNVGAAIISVCSEGVYVPAAGNGGSAAALPTGVAGDGAGGIVASGNVAAGAACPTGAPSGSVCGTQYVIASGPLRSRTGLTMIVIGTSIDGGSESAKPADGGSRLAAVTDYANALGYTDWPDVLKTMSTLSGRLVGMYNYAVPGYAIAQMTAQYTGGPMWGLPQPQTIAAAAGPNCIAFVGAPANDTPGITSDTTLTAQETAQAALWALPKADGCKVIAFTEMPRTAATPSLVASAGVPETAVTRGWREQFNKWVRNQQQNGLFDVLIDLARFLPDSTDATNFYDGTHLTTAGYYKVARMINARLWDDGETSPTDLYADNKINALVDDNLNLHASDVVNTPTTVIGSTFVKLTDRTLLLSSTPGDTNLNSSHVSGKRFTFINTSTGITQVYDATSGATINGVTGRYTLPLPGDWATLELDGSSNDWKILGVGHSKLNSLGYAKYTTTSYPSAMDGLIDCNGQVVGLGGAAQIGHELTFVNSSTTACAIQSSPINGSVLNYNLPQYGMVKFVWDGTTWNTDPGARLAAASVGGLYNVDSIVAGISTVVGPVPIVSCASGHTCTNMAGKITLITGAGVTAGGEVVRVNFTSAFPYLSAPDCSVWEDGVTTLHGWSTNELTTYVSLVNSVPLTSSTTYTLGYRCNGI